ncbi:MAG: hypothetical protein ACYC3X_22100 [Pirellulaceae bacterium]
MTAARHEAGHAIAARHFGWHVSSIVVNGDSGRTRMRIPGNLSAYRAAREDAIVSMAGCLAEHPLTLRQLMEDLAGTDKRGLAASLRVMLRNTHPALKNSMMVGLHREATKILVDHAAELDELTDRLNSLGAPTTWAR